MSQSSDNSPQEVAILIGNSDNKLTQREWSAYVKSVHGKVHRYAHVLHFSGGSRYDSPRQNACWVLAVLPEHYDSLRLALDRVRQRYRQDAIAVLTGRTEFIRTLNSQPELPPGYRLATLQDQFRSDVSFWQKGTKSGWVRRWGLMIGQPFKSDHVYIVPSGSVENLSLSLEETT